MEEREVCTRHFGQQKAAAFWNGMKRYPLQSRFLVPEKAEAGWKTKTQKACCSSSRYTETAQEFCHPSEQRQCHSADTFVHELVQVHTDPAAHTHIPDTSMYREYGYALRGQRVFGQVRGRKYQRCGIVAAQMGDRILAPFQYNGTMNSRLFEFWFSNQLLPSLEQGTVM